MKADRRKLLHLAANAAVLPILPSIALALEYPTHPVRIVVSFPPGTAPDIATRLMGEWLSQRFSQQFVIDNRPGAAFGGSP